MKPPHPPKDITARLAPWGEARILHLLPAGHRNIALRVEMDGKPYVAKSTRHCAPALHWVARLQRIAQQNGLSLAPYLRNRFGSFITAGWTLEPFLQGTPGTRADLASLRSSILRLHRAARHLPDRPGMARSRDLTRLGLPQTLRARLSRDLHTSLGTTAHTAIHADLHPANLLRLPSGHIALLDWDEARRDDAIFDLAALNALNTPAHRLMEIATGWRTEPAYARRLLHQRVP